MKEINYTRHMRMEDAPVIRKLGITGARGESTPFVWDGRLKWLHTVTTGDSVTRVFTSSFCVEDEATGEYTEPVYAGLHFYSCYVEDGTLYVFGTNEHGEGVWGGDTVTMLWSKDLVHFERRDIIHRPGWCYYNTSVCKGRDGKYVIAMEAGSPREVVGVRFTIFFAASDDLMNWTCMDDSIRYNDMRYTACPALRYLPEDDHYYMVCLEELPLKRYAPYIYRTRDFETWEIGIHNPVMWISAEDRMIAPGAHLTPEEEELARTYLNINDCDLDFCEFEGKTHISYLTGDQLSHGFHCKAIYDGPLPQFLQSFFTMRNA